MQFPVQQYQGSQRFVGVGESERDRHGPARQGVAQCYVQFQDQIQGHQVPKPRPNGASQGFYP